MLSNMGFNKILFILLTGILNVLISFTSAVKNGCEYYQKLIVGQQYYIYNIEYPDFYAPDTDCLWIGQSPIGTKIILSCEEINLPSTKNCALDKLKISLSGDSTKFRDSKNYCGYGSISLVSNDNRIAVELVANRTSSGGRFVCSVVAIKDTSPPNPNPSPDLCDCGWKKGTKIVNGVPTLINEYPSMAGLIDAKTVEIVCGATIISTRYVLSAAHCMRNVKLADMGILVGDWNITTGLDTSAAAVYVAENYWEHPDFDTIKQLNDLAIVKTKTPITFSLYVGPICLPFLYSYNDFTYVNVTILGWGQVFFNGPSSDVLQKVELQVVPNPECQAKLTDNIITENQLCTYSKGKDSCQQDSGGPVIWQDPNTFRLQLIGVISYGLGCATSRPGVNTRVTNYLAWIISITSDTNYCIK